LKICQKIQDGGDIKVEKKTQFYLPRMEYEGNIGLVTGKMKTFSLILIFLDIFE
jgi:hypothetical protein